jgi:hypothetical protein
MHAIWTVPLGSSRVGLATVLEERSREIYAMLVDGWEDGGDDDVQLQERPWRWRRRSW